MIDKIIPNKPKMEGILEEEGEMPLDIQKVINTNRENKLTPMPRG